MKHPWKKYQSYSFYILAWLLPVSFSGYVSGNNPFPTLQSSELRLATYKVDAPPPTGYKMAYGSVIKSF